MAIPLVLVLCGRYGIMATRTGRIEAGLCSEAMGHHNNMRTDGGAQ